MSLDGIGGIGPKAPTGPLSLPPKVIVETEIIIEEIAPAGRKGGLGNDRTGLNSDAGTAMRNTGRLPPLDASGIPDVGMGELNGLRGGKAHKQHGHHHDHKTGDKNQDLKNEQHIGASLGSLSDAMTNCKDPTLKKMINELMEAVSGLRAQIGRIHSAGIQDMLMAMLGSALRQAAGGNISGALDTIGRLQGLTNKCEKLVDKIVNNIARLMSMVVAGPAGKVMTAIAQAAKDALGKASGVADLEALSDMTDRAVALANQLSDQKVGSRHYNETLELLAGVLGGIQALASMESGNQTGGAGGAGGDGGQGGFGKDQTQLSGDSGNPISNQGQQGQPAGGPGGPNPPPPNQDDPRPPNQDQSQQQQQQYVQQTE